MRRNTQLNRIRAIIEVRGWISRNYCLLVHITRLSAYILDLKNEGYEILGKKKNNDYVYTLLDRPKESEVKIVERIDSSGKITRLAVYK